MLIILNIKAHVPCAEIYAQANHDRDQAYQLGTEQVRSVKFWHNQHTPSLSVSALPHIQANDQYLQFDSDVPFSLFCALLEHSEFNNQAQYNYFTHNCAYGAAFALRKAGIGLDIPKYIFFNRIGDRAHHRMPASSFSPLDLFYIAKTHKLAELQGTHINRQFVDAKRRIYLRLRKSKQSVKRKVDALIKLNDQFYLTHPEHAKTHLKILLVTLHLLMKPQDTLVDQRTALLRHHLHRQPKAWLDEPLPMAVNFLCVTVMASILKGIYNTLNNKVTIDERSYTGSYNGDALLGIGLGGALIGLSLFSMNMRRPIVETALTEQMRGTWEAIRAANTGLPRRP